MITMHEKEVFTRLSQSIPKLKALYDKYEKAPDWDIPTTMLEINTRVDNSLEKAGIKNMRMLALTTVEFLMGIPKFGLGGYEQLSNAIDMFERKMNRQYS